ncbi:MAG: hypothetical protein WBN89_07020 [Prochlorococcaceae cyanobacterium]
MNEAETRAELIDPLLVAAGWGVVEATPRTAPLSEGVAQAKDYAPLLRLRYHNSIADAVADLGRPAAIGQLFAGFQRYLYEPWNSG